jgi:hypothetical protein
MIGREGLVAAKRALAIQERPAGRWAVVRDGATRALRVFDDRAAAEAWIAQRTGTPPAQAVAVSEEIRTNVDEAYDKVPEIGAGWRWYDIPYRLLRWLLWGPPKRVLPQIARTRIVTWINWLSPLNEHERHKAWPRRDRMHDFSVPEDERAFIPSIWAVELFPPSEIGALERTIERRGWDKDRWQMDEVAGAERLHRLRARSGPTWWRLATVSRPRDGTFAPDAVLEKVPADFRYIEVRAIQLGPGLTAVAARFDLTDDAAVSVDSVWHAPHEPQLRFRGLRRPIAEERMWAAFRMTQEARYRLHREVRDWMRERCPGFFAAAGEDHPIFDMILMDHADPAEINGRGDREFEEALRALGITGHGWIRRTFNEVPGFVAVPTEPAMARAMRTHRSWAVWGNVKVAAEASDHLSMYGTDTDRALARQASDALEGLLVMLAISGFLESARRSYSTLRDTARTLHQRSKPKAVRELRDHLLRLSLDLTSVQQDLLAFWRSPSRMIDEAQVTIDYAQWLRDDDRRRGRGAFTPESLNENLREAQKAELKELIEADRQYREILATAASLGASIEAGRLGRRALIVAGASLAVALVTLLIAETGPHSPLQWVMDHLPW